MKIIFVASGNSKNGISPIVQAQGHSLESQGLQIDYFCIRGKGLKGYIQNIPILYKHIQDTKPDIIHAHYGASAIAAYVAKGSYKIVASFMGDDILGSNRADGSIKKKSVLMAKLCRLFANRFFNHSIVKSLEMANKIKTDQKTIIPNGVNLSIFRPLEKDVARKKLGIDLKDLVALFVSNPMRPEKNFTLADSVVKKIALPNLRLFPVHNLNHNELANYYNAADVLLLTSYHEGSPNVIKEAMACNCPIVTTNVGDVEWVLGNTEGCFISSFDVDDYAKKTKFALEFAGTKGRTSGRNRIVELGLDDESIAKKIISVYKKVLR